MADNSSSGQYQVSDPTGSSYTPEQTPDPSQQIAPTPDGQMPPQQSAPQSTPANLNAPDVSSPNPGPQGGQQPSQVAAQAPAAAPQQPQTRTQKFLSRARQISDEIAGGDPYKTTIDPNTGETTRTRQPLSPRAISLSIIMEALQGGLSGAGAHGPDAVGQAAQAGLKQGEQIADQRQKAQAASDEQAQTDLKTKQQVVTNLLQTRLLAQNVGKQSFEQAQKSVDAWADKWKQHQDDPTSIIAQDLSHDDAYASLAKQGYGNAEVEITGVRPRTDKTGAPVYQLPNGQIVYEDTPGAYQAPDFVYALVKPLSKISATDNDGNFLPAYSKAANRGFVAVNAGANGKMPPNFQMTSTDSQTALLGSRNADAIQAEANTARASMGLPPINIDGDLKADSNVRNAMTMYSAALNKANSDGVPNPHQAAYNAVANSKWGSAAGTIQNWYGGADATKHLDAQHTAQTFDSGVLNGDVKLDNPQAIASARLSNNPKVKAAGDAQFKQNEQDTLSLKRAEAQQAANIEAGKEISVARAKNAMAQQGGTDNPNFGEAPNAQGVRQNYLNSLSNADRIRAIGEGRVPMPTDRSAKSISEREAVSHAYPTYTAAKYNTWQKASAAYTSGNGVKGIQALNQALLHGEEAYNNVTMGSTLPGVSTYERWRGNDQANGYNAAIDAFASELGTAVKGGVLDQKDADRWIADVRGSNPASARSKIRTTLPLLKARLDTLQQTLDQASVTGVAPIQVLHQDAANAYNRVSGNQTQGSSQQPTANQPAAPQKGATQVYGGFTYTFDGSKYVKGAPVSQ